MTKPCPSCGAETHPGARYCRRCGTPVRAATGDGDGTGEVSPQAATVPLNSDARATDGLGADEQQLPSNDTARVNRSDLEHLLRTQQMSPGTPRTREVADVEEGAATLIQQDRGALAGEFARFESSLGRGVEDVEDTNEIENASEIDETPVTPLGGGGFGMTTRETFIPEDDELTVLAPRRVRPPGGDGAGFAGAEHSTGAGAEGAHERAQGGGISLEIVDGADAPPSDSLQQHPAPTATNAPVAPGRRRVWPLFAVAGVAALALALAAAWLAFAYLRPQPATGADAGAPPAPAPPDARQLFEEKLAEAESLLAAGQSDEAMARLREANAIDPANTRAHRRLGELLLEGGARREAIEEFRAVTRNDPEDFTAWRQLASAQFAEGLHGDAAESYRRLIALVGEATADPNDLLSYADALARSGRAEEARAVYQRLTNTPDPEVASAARQRLAELAAPSPTPSPGQKAAETARSDGEAGGETPNGATPAAAANAPATPEPAATAPPQPAPTQAPARPPASTPAEHYRRGVELWSSNRAAALNEFRAAGNNPEANYYLGLSYVEGRDTRSLSRAAVVAALQHFQIAQRGQFAEQARRHARQLEREFDRLTKQ